MPYIPSARVITSSYPEGIDTSKRRVGNDMHGVACNLPTHKRRKNNGTIVKISFRS